MYLCPGANKLQVYIAKSRGPTMDSCGAPVDIGTVKNKLCILEFLLSAYSNVSFPATVFEKRPVTW